MGLVAAAIRPLAAWTHRQVRRWYTDSERLQQKWFERLVRTGRKTKYGQKIGLGEVHNYEDYRQRVPLVRYEDLLPYIEEIKSGVRDVLWPGRPAYFAKTSGTTAGAKYIPLTREQLKHQIKAARQALFNYVHLTDNAHIFEGKMLFLSGSPEVDKVGAIPAGRLSGIVHRHIPAWALRNRLPSWETNIIPDWETKLERVIDEVLAVAEQFTLLSGIPPWVQMFLERLQERTGRPPYEVLPNLKIYVHGGVQFTPYEPILRRLLGPNVDFLETFPASEGFIAFQDWVRDGEGLILLPDHGIFYEFIPVEDAQSETPRRLPLWEVEPGASYEVVLTTNAGLWAYRLGDVVRFVSVRPYRLVVTGRVSQYISAFGEHVIIEELEKALQEGLKQAGGLVREFHVAPQLTPSDARRPYHEWFIEFIEVPEDMAAFAMAVDKALQKLNPYYKDLREGNILEALKVRPLRQGGFHAYLKQIGKLGGQFKVPRVANDRRHAEGLQQFVQTT